MLPAAHRLKGKKIFNDLFRFGKTFSNDLLLMKICAGEKDEPTKFGFAASLKYSKKAVERNRAKRWMRAAVRASLEKIQPGWQVIFFINPKAPKDDLTLKEIQNKAENLLKKAKIL
ncbi:MAG TPA: ribonuclease P protein component [Candidatus Bathyarchaeia archaeon]|nr:ribonuclease P protein component [Candidatus Bathyarchaeia archaeon]